MSGTREIKRRMKAVKSTAQVTRAMQLVAASKMKHAQQAALNSRPYAQLLAQFFAAMNVDMDQLRENPLFQKRKVETRGILVISPDKGLCGGMLTNLNREILKLPQDGVYVAIGRRASQTISRLHRELLAEFTLSDKARFSELKPACEMMINAYHEGVIDTFEILYTGFVSPVKQVTTLETLLPIADFDSVIKSFPKNYLTEAPLKNDERAFIVEPNAAEILSHLLPLYIKQELYHTALESKASEHSARMVAMKNATDNANELNARLTLSYNKARQAAITNEILELAAANGAGGGN